METSEAGRFQLWEYMVSHRQLLLRRPATGMHPTNVDLVFGGVKYVALPSSIRNPRVRPAKADEVRWAEEALGTQIPIEEIHVIEGDSTKGFVVAGSARRVVNELEIFESSLERFGDSRSSAERLEREVLLALASFHPELEPALPSGKPTDLSRLDALIRLDDQVLGLDVKWVSPDRTHAAIRNRVIEAVQRLDPWLDHLSGLLVVVGTHDPRAIQEARDHLLTAIGSHVRVNVVGWMSGDDPGNLGQAVRQLSVA